jgi:hypothetical protein
MAPSQIQDYVFNVYGWAIQIPNDIREGMTVLNGLKPSTTPWEKVVELLEAKGEQPWRSSLSLTPEERDDRSEADGAKLKYILIGFTSRGLKPEYFKKHPSQKKQRPVVTQLNPKGVIDSPDFPVMVVAQIQRTEPTGISLFALLEPKHGLCRPYHIGKHACFNLPIFRDDTTCLQKRMVAWNRLVRKACIRPPVQASTQGDKTAEVAAESRDEAFQLPEVLENFLDNVVTSWHETDSEDMVRVFHETWPDARGLCNLKVVDICLIKSQMLGDDLWVEDRHLRPFFLACKTLIAEEERKAESRSLDPDWSNNCATALKLVTDMLGSTELEAPVPMGQDDESL